MLGAGFIVTYIARVVGLGWRGLGGGSLGGAVLAGVEYSLYVS